MRIAVTGAGGFLGAHLVRALLAGRFDVRAVLRPGSDAPNLTGLDVEFAENDVGEDRVDEALFAGCDGVIHLAACYPGEGTDAAALLRVNVNGAAFALRNAAAAGVRRFVHCSSMGTVVVPGSQRPATETDALGEAEALLSDYNRSKLLGEREVLRGRSDLEVVVVNPAAPVGAWDSKPTVTGARIRDVVRGIWPRLLAGPVNHVSAAACALGMVQAFRAGRPGERYLLGDRDLGPEEFVAKVAAAAGREPPTRSLMMRLRGQYRPSPGAFPVDAGKARRELDWDPGDLDAAIKEAASWFAST